MYAKLALVALAGAVVAQDQSICDKYTTALLMDNTPANQLGLLTKLVNTAVIGNYTMPNMNAVPGILTPGEYMGEQVSLAKYFDGSMNTTNRGGNAVMVSFLDGGGATPLMMDMPANDTNTNQGRLLTHLYSYFGLLLGCSGVGMGAYPAYAGSNSQAQVHQFMNLSNAEFGYFVQQVALSAQSFGVSMDDITTVGGALMDTFGYRCLPAASVGGAPSMLQSICQGSTCGVSPMGQDCAAYASIGSNGDTMSGTPTASPSGGAATSSSAAPMETTGAASFAKVGVEGVLGAAAAALAFL